MTPWLLPLLFVSSVLPTQAVPADEVDASTPDSLPWGHSRHGAAYDEGPRRKPWKMEGIGEVHFPISTSHPEVQAWFDQGMALLHGFWGFEAERSFRWCAKLDPDCAMAYWGLSRCTWDNERSAAFLEKASALKGSVTPRERGFIEVQELLQEAREVEDDEDAREELEEQAVVRLDKLLMDHPGDVEALAYYWLVVSDVQEGDGARFGLESVLQQVLERQPDHVGALHYRVHNWDGKEGRYAIDSCTTLSAVAPNCGHLQHMPGHVLSGIGMWHEAAIAMDSATRVEKAYMHRRRILPEDNWDYVHNLDYLGYLREQLGMFETALQGARQLLLAPPATPDGEGDGPPLGMFVRSSAYRTLLKAERWEEVLDCEWLDWTGAEDPPSKMLRAYGEVRAHLGLGQVEAAEEKYARLEELVAGMPGPPEGAPRPAREMQRGFDALWLELEGLLAIARGENLEGIEKLTEAARLQEDAWYNDPPRAAFYGYNTLGEALLELGSPRLAAEAFEKTLETVFHDFVALSGLVRSYYALGRHEEAGQALADLELVLADADDGNRWLDAARATGVVPARGELDGLFAQPMQQRSYREAVLDVLGPSTYEPASAPALSARDARGEAVTLADFRGKNVILVFYLGDRCLHCIEQLRAAHEEAEALRELDAVVVAVSKDDVERLAGYQPDFDVTLLSDPDFENARRFGSYDDFEELELHSTLLLDAEGRVHWARYGGEPFMDFDFLKAELRRLNEGGVVHTIRGMKTARR